MKYDSESKPVSVFNFTPRKQLNRLLVGPLIAVSKSYEADAHDRSQDSIILFHPFEDCNNEGDCQEVFLFDLMEALSVNTIVPQRPLLIGNTDRLEELMGRLSSRLPTYNAQGDIREFKEGGRLLRRHLLLLGQSPTTS